MMWKIARRPPYENQLARSGLVGPEWRTAPSEAGSLAFARAASHVFVFWQFRLSRISEIERFGIVCILTAKSFFRHPTRFMIVSSYFLCCFNRLV
jgi:hypothetical protein